MISTQGVPTRARWGRSRARPKPPPRSGARASRTATSSTGPVPDTWTGHLTLGARSRLRRVHARSDGSGAPRRVAGPDDAWESGAHSRKNQVLTGSSEHESWAPDFQAGAPVDKGPICEATKPQPVAAGRKVDHKMLWFGWRGRIRTFDLLIQSQTPLGRFLRAIALRRARRAK